MTHVDTRQSERLPHPAAVRQAMNFAATPPMMGVEIEYHMMDLRGRGLVAATDARVYELKQALRTQHNIAVDDEIGGHMLEVKTAAYALRDMRGLLAEIDKLQRIVMDEALARDLKPVPFAAMPGLTAPRALRNLIRPTAEEPQRGARARTMMAALRAAGEEAQIAYPLLNASAQVSIGARDADHLYAMMRRHYLLTPFLFTLFHNRAPQADGEHGGIAARRALGDRGMIPRAFAQTDNAEAFIMQHLRDVFARPMLCTIDLHGAFTRAAGRPTLHALAAAGMATRGNVMLAQSMDWHCAKMKPIPGGGGMRAELRDMDISGFAARDMAVMTGLMSLDPACGAAVDSLLAGYGYPAAPRAVACRLHADTTRAMREAGRGLLLPYGDGRMDWFARDLLAVLRPYALRHGVADGLATLEHAVASGRTVAQLLAARLPDPAAARAFARGYDPALMTDPRRHPALSLA